MNPVLDSGALIALERRDRRMVALADEIVRNRVSAYVPAGVVAQVWRGSPRQHAIARLLQADAVRIDPLDDELAFRIGARLAATGSSDVVDGHVALLARRTGGKVLTSDPDDIRALDLDLTIEVV
jgi:predicted nucleic acid-binding protein